MTVTGFGLSRDVIVVVLLAFGIGVGAAVAAEEKEQIPVILQVEDLHEAYLHGSLATARESALEQVRLLKREFEGSREIRAHGLYRAYASLYLIDVASGLEADAYLDYIRGQYWYMEHLAEQGMAPDTIGSKVRMLTEERFRQDALERDGKATGGRGAMFARSLGLYDTEAGVGN